MRTRLALTVFASAFLCLVCAMPAWAELCEKCREKAFTTDTKPCPSCGENMQSGSWAFCSKCADEKRVCPACGGPLPQTPVTPPGAPPGTPPVAPADERKPEPEKKPAEIVWLDSYEEALKQAKAKPRPIFLFFFQKASQSSQVAENKVVKDAQVAPLAVQFICLKLDPKKNAELAKTLEQRTAPAFILLDQEGKKIAHLKEKTKADQLAAEMKKILDSLKKQEEVGIEWLTDVEQGIQKARTERKCLLFYFHSPGDAKCVEIEEGVFKDPDMIRASKHLVCVKTDCRKPLSKPAAEKFDRKVQTLPTIFLSNTEVTELDIATFNDSVIIRKTISSFLARFGMNAAFDAEEEKIENERASQAMASKRISISAKELPLQDVAAQFRAQDVALCFADDFPADKLVTPVTINVVAPIEEAVSKLCDIAGLTYEITADKIILRVR